MRRVVTATAWVALLATPGAGSAQFAPGARAVGMGGAGIVYATGVEAIESNPANLASGQGWNVSIFELGASTLSTGATFSEIMAIMGGDFLGSGDVDVPDVIDRLSDDGISVSVVAEGYAAADAAEGGGIPRPGSPLPSIGVTVGSFGLRVRSRVFVDMTMDRDLADLIGNGFDPARIQDYSVGDTRFRELSVSEITGSYGTTVGELLSVGVGLRYVNGHQMVDGRFFEPVLDMLASPSTLTVPSVAVEATGGSGWGLDMGLSLDLPHGLRAAVSGTNVVQRMTWDENLVAHSASFSNAEIDANDFVDLLDLYDSGPVDPNSVSLAVLQVTDGLFEGSYYPATWRGGVGYRSGGTSVELTGVAVSPRGRFRTAWDERVSLGVEQRVPVLTLRAGMARAQDGVRALTAGLGIRVGPVHLDASGGKFSGDSETSTVYDGYHATFALQIRAGGAS